MESNEIRFKVRPVKSQPLGQSIEVLVLTPTNRILASVQIQVSLDAEFPLAERIGEEKFRQIIEDAKSLARRLAEGVAQPTGPG